MSKMRRCLAQLSLAGSWGTENLWPGLEVDLNRELAPGVTIAEAIQGREDCFEPIKHDAHAAHTTHHHAPATHKSKKAEE